MNTFWYSCKTFGYPLLLITSSNILFIFFFLWGKGRLYPFYWLIGKLYIIYITSFHTYGLQYLLTFCVGLLYLKIIHFLMLINLCLCMVIFKIGLRNPYLSWFHEYIFLCYVYWHCNFTFTFRFMLCLRFIGIYDVW